MNELKKILISLIHILLLTNFSLLAQVGVNTDKPMSDLDIIAKSGKNLLNLKDSAEKNLLLIDSVGRMSVNSKHYPIKIDLRNDLADSSDHSLGIGYTDSTAAVSGKGAIKYNPTSKTLEFSNEYAWVPLSIGKERAFFTGNLYNEILRGYTGGDGVITISISKWNVLVDDSNTYDNSGGFEAPRDGMYSASATIVLDNLVPADGKIFRYELMLSRIKPDDVEIEINFGGFKNVETYFSGTGDSSVAASSKVPLTNTCKSIFYLDKGDRLVVSMYIVNSKSNVARVTNDPRLSTFTVVEM